MASAAAEDANAAAHNPPANHVTAATQIHAAKDASRLGSQTAYAAKENASALGPHPQNAAANATKTSNAETVQELIHHVSTVA